jgi:hypothetical protein
MLSNYVVNYLSGFGCVQRTLAPCSASVIKAFHNAQPRPRDQVSLSSESALRNASRLFPERNVHAIVKSQAGSPTPEDPKSMTAFNRPPLTNKFAALTSPWTQTGRPRHLVLSASSQTEVTTPRSIVPARSPDRFAGLRVIDFQRSTPIEVVRPRRRTICRIDPLQRAEKLCESDRELAQIGETLAGCDFTFQPAID